MSQLPYCKCDTCVHGDECPNSRVKKTPVFEQVFQPKQKKKPTVIVRKAGVKKQTVVMYTDGACRGNPGHGGAGVFMQTTVNKTITHRFKQIHVPNTTNNRMELLACIIGLKELTEVSEVVIYSDSRYVVDGMTSWIKTWIKKNWKGSNAAPIKNVDLWKELHSLASAHSVRFKWVRGHSGDRGNYLADRLATKAADCIYVKSMSEIDPGF